MSFRAAHLELFCGASGDMLLGALIDCGVPVAVIQQSIDQLDLPDVRIQVDRVTKRGIAATKATVLAPHQHVHRHLSDVVAIIERSSLASTTKATARRVFEGLAVAEGRVHAIPVDHVHFHEVGALDAIADVVGVVAGFVHLEIERLSCRGVPLSHGIVKCEHGVLPVPAPAVVHLLEGLPTYPLDIDGETVTPTAAALLRELVTDWGSPSAMTVARNGYGAGSKEFPRANVLRLVLFERTESAAETVEELALLETNLDDMNPEWLPPLLQRLLDAGARDAWLTPILMKKGRPAHTLAVLAPPERCEALRAIVYRHSTTLGIRATRVDRFSLPREVTEVTTQWGVVRIKVARLPDGTEKAAPEHEDCAAASAAHGVALPEVYEAAIAAWRRGYGSK